VSKVESELVSRAQSGDKEAFCRLAKAYEQQVFSLALYYCRSWLDAEDLSQEVWLKAYRALKGFRGESSFYTWLRQITINTFLNSRRTSSFANRERELDVGIKELELNGGTDGLCGGQAQSFEEELHKKIMVEKVMQALGELTEQQRIIFLLKHKEGMTCEEISGVLSCSPGTVKKSLFRAVNKLREHFDADRVSLEGYMTIAAVKTGGLES
jgi:RNA polymerase sigma-70 factor, ECF subfamily